MGKIIRLTESELTRIVKRIMEEEENAFTFGDKVRAKLGKLIGNKENTPEQKQIANDIYDSVKRNEFVINDSMDGFVGKGYKITVQTKNGNYLVKVQKRKVSLEGPKIWSTEIEKIGGESFIIFSGGYSSKLFELIRQSED